MSFRVEFSRDLANCQRRWWLIAVLACQSLLGGTARVAWAAHPDGQPSVVAAQARGRGGHDWPTFLGPTGDNRSAETGYDFTWPESGPELVWSRALGDSYGIGSIANGRYYQFDHVAGQAQVFCLQADTGQPLWKFSYDSKYEDMYGYGAGPRTSPVIDEDRVYVLGVEGQLYCLGAEDGKEIWRVDTQRQFGVVQNFFGVGSTPCVFADLLLVMVGGSPADDQSIPPGQLDRVSGNGSGVVAFDKRTGEMRYQISHELASYAALKVVQRPDRAWCFALMRGGLLAFNPQTGEQDFFFPWRAKSLESVNASTPVCWDDRVFISETYGPGSAVLQFTPGQYQLLWSDQGKRRDQAMQTHWNTAIYHEGYLYGCSGRHTNNAELRCIEAETGRVMWSQPGLARLSLLYVDDHLISLDEYGMLRVLRANPQRYELVREFTPGQAGTPDTPLLKFPAWAAPILSHGLMYVRGKDHLACYRLPRRSFAPGSSPAGTTR